MTPEVERTGKWASARAELARLVGSGFLIALIGPRGTGKTQLAVETARAACRIACERPPPSHGGDESSAFYVKVTDMFLTIRAGYKKDGPTEKDLIDAFIRPGLLVVDEIQERGETAWEDRMLMHILDRRYDEVRDTLLIGNLTPRKLAESVGPSIISRMVECGRIIVCDWASFRKASVPPECAAC